MVAVKNPEIRKAVNTLYELSADEKVRAEYEMRQKAWRDRAWMIDEAKDYARAEGKTEERQYILGLINQGISIEEIKQHLQNGKP